MPTLEALKQGISEWLPTNALDLEYFEADVALDNILDFLAESGACFQTPMKKHPDWLETVSLKSMLEAERKPQPKTTLEYYRQHPEVVLDD